MKPLKTIFSILAVAVSLIMGAGCEPGETTSQEEITPYEYFSRKFEEYTTGEWSSTREGTYNIAFRTGSLVLDPAETRVKVCTPATWPAVTRQGGTWRVDGQDTGVAFVSDRSSEQIVVVIYDGEGIYVRLSSGNMFYFHRSSALDVGCFRFEKALNPSLTEDVICTLSNNSISGYLGRMNAATQLIPTFGSRGAMTVSGGRSVTSSVTPLDFQSGTVQLQTETGGMKQYYTVSLEREVEQVGIKIPVLRIDSKGQGAPSSKVNYMTVSMRIEDPDMNFADVPSETVVTEIRGRGNSTWNMPKRPYKIKLSEAKRMFGMSNNKHWVLLANYSDKSLLRTSAAFKLSELAGMEWPIRWVPVELYIDNNYYGVYTLCEHVRSAEERVEVTPVTPADNSGEAITGGYLICIDYKDLAPEHGEAPKVGYWHQNATGSSFPVAFDEPEAPTPEQIDYIKSYLKEVERAIYSHSLEEINKVLDVESCIQYFFVQELAKNVDSDMRLSTYVAKARGGKLYFPCVWDFDIAFGNCNYGNDVCPAAYTTTDWMMRGAVWFRQLFRIQEFCDLVARRWAELYPKLSEMEPLIRQWAADMDQAQKRNFETWPILGVYVWPNYNPENRTTYKAEIDYLINFLNMRKEWINGEIKAGRHKWN